MPIKQIIRPDRLRQVPRQFNWIDHRLVQDRHIQRCGHADWTLYLFLVTVGDYQGLSYYSDRSIQKLLSMNQATLWQARENLIKADFIAFDPPLYQILSLEVKRVAHVRDQSRIAPTIPQPHQPNMNEADHSNVGPEAIGLILRRLRELP